MCGSMSKQGRQAVQKTRPVHQMQERDEESCNNSHDKNNGHIDVVKQKQVVGKREKNRLQNRHRQ